MKNKLLFALFLVWSQIVPPAFPQQTTITQQPSAADGDEVVRISTNLVQIDAVVTDRKGNRVTDLKAEDFEVLENNRPQSISNFTYVPADSPTREPALSKKARDEEINAAPPVVRLRPEQVQRTLALVVDDLGLSFESMAFVRHSLKNFVNQQLQPGDLAAVIRTSAGTGALQQFTADKRQLLAAIERISWYPYGRAGISTFKPIDLDPLERLKARSPQDAFPGGVDYSGTDSDIDNYRQDVFSVGTLGAINYVVRGMRSLPGRKSVLLVSDGLTISRPVQRGQQNGASGREDRDRDVSGVLESLNKLTDFANRASVVIYTMDARGLQTFGLSAQDDTRDLTTQQVADRLVGQRDEFYAAQDGLNYLAQRTGGFFIHDNNDLAGGMKKVLDDQKGYYLLGYRPDESTFDRGTGRRSFHRLEVRVKRPGLRVRTRTGFYGVTDEEIRAAPRTGNEQLLAALESPFNSGDVRLRLTSLFGSDEKAGSFMRSLLHIDGRDLSFKDQPDGWHQLSFDILAVTFGAQGEIIDQYGRTETMRVSDEAFRQARQHGLIYNLNIPVKKAGAYQMRLAVRDVPSNRVGSANQFIEVPDLRRGRLALSGVALTGIKPQTATETITAPADPEAGPAVRRFHPGMVVQYACLIYNAKAQEKTKLPQLQTRVRLYREGKLIYTGKIFPYEMKGQIDRRRLPLSGTLQLGQQAQPGQYVLQIIAEDLLIRGKNRVTTNWSDFEIVPVGAPESGD